MASHEDDLSLLLSLNTIPETPPGSPSRSPLRHFPDLSPVRRHGASSDMSVFRDAVKKYLSEDSPEDGKSVGVSKSVKGKGMDDADVEKFSGLRLRKCLISQVEINNYFLDLRFVRLTAIRNLLIDDTISGCWATVGVLVQKGSPKKSSNGKTFCVCKLSALSDVVISVFLFGDAYANNMNERVGTVFAIFNAAVRKENVGNGFCLSVNSAVQIVKMGFSADYGVCKGKRKDGLSCTMAINKRQGDYCKYHASSTARRYSTKRTELAGGNLNLTSAFRQSERIYLYDPLSDGDNSKKQEPLKVLSVDGLKRALSGANKVTTNKQSQGIRFLSEVTANLQTKMVNRGSEDLKNVKTAKKSAVLKNVKTNPIKRLVPGKDVASITSNEENCKRTKVNNLPKMIDLDLVSSDEER